MESTNLLVIFLTGLTTGGLTCLALQGGLLATVIAKQENDLIKKNKFVPLISFLYSKLFIHTLLGALLGFLGSAVSLTPITRGWLQILIGIYLFGIAGNLLNLHPLFRYFVITPPKFLAKLIKKESKDDSIFAPAILGLMTVFIPCATTQAMEIIAIGSRSPLYGAAIMFSFVLGTSPTFLIFGFLLNKSSLWFKRYFPSLAATAMFIMSIYTINAGVGLTGSIYTIQNFVSVAVGVDPRVDPESPTLKNNTQSITINVTNNSYSPNNITLKKGILTKIKLITNNVQSCSRSFVIPQLNIQKLLPVTGEETLEFTPTETGPLAFSCSMGMYTGKFNIIN